MSYLKKFTFDQPQLCIFYLGGKVEGCSIEMHDVVFAVGSSSDEIIPKLKKKWCGTLSSLHVDSWFAVDNVDGFDIQLTPSNASSPSQGPHLYFVNLGSYGQGLFGENHFMTLEVAETKSQAASKAKSKVKLSYEQVMIHTDNNHLVDDCIKLKVVDDYAINLVYTGKNLVPNSVNGWQRI